MPLVTKAGFIPVDSLAFTPLAALPASGAVALEIPNDADPVALSNRLNGVETIRIPFPSSHDGRGFSLARRLRDLGYRGRLRAAGHIISDQFRYALDCGFDEVEIDDTLAARQPQAHWQAEAGARTYRDKLKGAALSA